MPGSFSDYLENKVLDHLFGGTAYSAPATVYVALFTITPGDAGGGTEVTGNNYSRVAVTNNGTNFPAASGGSKSNGTTITFPTASGAWGTVVAVGIFDAANAGNLLAWASLNTSKTIGSGDTASFPASSLTITLD